MKGVVVLPQRLSALKDLRKNYRRRMHNLDIKTDIKKAIKDFRALIDEKKVEEAKNLLKTIFKKLDKAVKTKLLHKNNAARKKSQYSLWLQKISK